MHEDHFDHYHADDGTIIALQKAHPLWAADRIEIRSVGIDIGSSTSHLIFSTLVMRRQSAILSSRFQLTERRVEYASPILLTPFLGGATLDVDRLAAFIDEAYADAGWDAREIDTGAVITTGDAARKDNAEAVVTLFSAQAGKFVCASAGPLLEAKMAAYGSGAVARSVRPGDRAVTVLNIDVGGGTSKLAIARGGRVVDVSAIDVGARLVTFDQNGVLTKIERGAAVVAHHRGLRLEVGEPVPHPTREDLAAALADALLEVAGRRPPSPLTEELLITAPLQVLGEIDVVTFSGGVSEYVYAGDVPDFGDIGRLLGERLRTRLASELPDATLETPVQGIRATVIGASQFTAQVSGNTIFIGHPGLLPLRNLQVVPVDLRGRDLKPGPIARAIRRSLAKCEAEEPRPIAIAVRWPHGPAYAGLDALARGLVQGLERHLEASIPLVLVIDADIARLVGNIVSEHLGGRRDVLCIDGIDVQEFDYIDIGEEHASSGVVTVIVKSLVFTG